MKKFSLKNSVIAILFVSLLLLNSAQVKSCSTFMLHKEGKLIFGHNLNEGDMGVPGLLFVNKRGVFKTGRSLSELMSADKSNASELTWISRYGSITFNNFGKDLPDGGMNEAGFFIEEMNEDPVYPKGENKHKLSQMGWMQFLLDNCATLDEALEITKTIEIDGWGWHYFLADASGDCASLTFVDGEMKINRGADMPVKALFNTPYDREMEVAKYFENFGGLYDVEIDNPEVPRFVKTDYLIKNYDPSQDIVEYGFYMLDKIKVNDIAEWSIVFDAKASKVYFRTRINPAIKEISMDDIDFSAEAGPCLIQNMDIAEGGDIKDILHPYTAKEMNDFLLSLGEIAGMGFFEMGGLKAVECIDNLTNHSLRAAKIENQYFKGIWETRPEDSEEGALIINLSSTEDAVYGEITASNGSVYKIDHLYLMNQELGLTFRTKSGVLIEIKALIDSDKMKAETYGTEDYMGPYTFYRGEL